MGDNTPLTYHCRFCARGECCIALDYVRLREATDDTCAVYFIMLCRFGAKSLRIKPVVSYHDY